MRRSCLKVPRLVNISSGSLTHPASPVDISLNFTGGGMRAKVQGEDAAGPRTRPRSPDFISAARCTHSVPVYSYTLAASSSLAWPLVPIARVHKYTMSKLSRCQVDLRRERVTRCGRRMRLVCAEGYTGAP